MHFVVILQIKSRCEMKVVSGLLRHRALLNTGRERTFVGKVSDAMPAKYV